MKVGGQILWNVIPICETSQISCLMGRPHMRDVLGNHLKDQSFRLVHISTESQLCCRGTRFGHSMDADVPVQNENFSRDGKEFTKVSRVVGKAKCYFYGQHIGVCEIL